MALTNEILTANEALKGLTEDQLTAIAQLSANDENTVIGQKIGELHGKYDADVMAVAGVQKNQGEKSYDFVKRVLGDFKGKAEKAATLETEIGTLKGQITDYEQKFRDGKGSEAIALKLKDAETKLGQLQGQYDTEKQDWTAKETQYATEINGVKLNVELEKATSGLKFKAIYPAEVQTTLLDSAKARILTVNKPDWIDNGKGGKQLIFRDDKGEIIRNPENRLEPMTAAELMTKELKAVLDFGKQQGGAGTDGGQGGQGGEGGEMPDLAGAKNQVQADDLIIAHLMKKGLTRGSQAFAEQQTKIRKELSVDKLPVR